MDERQQKRIATNESRFRDMNEQVRRAVDQFEQDGDHYSMMCECALTECADMIELERPEYAHVRSNDAWFVVKPDHVLPAAEVAVEANDRYWIIEKVEAGQRVAEALAPDAPLSS